MTLQPVVSLWIGPSLSAIERLSLASFIANGHPTALYAYGAVEGVPPGVELRDAAAILPRDVAEQNRYPSGSYALFSNLFRFELQRRGLGLWVDADVVCVRPVTIEGPFVAGRESPRFLNGAVLRLAPDSPVIADWFAAWNSGRVPPWLPLRRAIGARFRQWHGQPVRPTELPFGTFGPRSITALATRHGLVAAAQPEPIFYPVPPREAERIYDPAYRFADVVRPETLTIHLWNEKLGPLKRTVPPEGSPLAELFARYGVAGR